MLTSNNGRGDPPSEPGNGVPSHIAIIMDGNGRWAKQRSLPRAAGHRAGVEAVRRVVRAAGELGVQCFTLFSFSSENWSRPQSEIDALMTLMKRFVHQDLTELHQNNVRVRIIGSLEGLDSEIAGLIEHTETLTAGNSGLQLVIAFNYGARDEIARAARALAEAVAAGRIDPASITPEALGAHLDTTGIPDPDLLIRTSGEQRLSNFLLWQSAYTELAFVETLWPDFGHDDLASAIDEYRRRERRFGGLSARRKVSG